jgi:homogentisate phytyltransferase / homogentisate geranylgeranyltransferase
MAIPALHFLAAPSLQEAALSLPTWYAILYATIPALFMNLYITGLNQITDVDIDKINKPYLPMAAGLLSQRTAIITVTVALLSSLYLGTHHAHAVYATPGLRVALYGSALLGTLYSLPPFRFKRFPLLAAFCIVAVRGAIINAAFFTHALQAAAAAAASTATSVATTTTTTSSAISSVLSCLQNYKSCLYSSAFFAIFGLVIALMKDVPDVIGDRRANIFTFSVRIGPRRVFDLMKGLLTTLFWSVSATFATMAIVSAAAAAATTSSSSPGTVLGLVACRTITSVASWMAGWSVQRQARNVNPEDSGQVYKYYMHLWKLFYLSYVVLPFCR